ncbi:hypothetical protein HanRHA438_Chr00c49g0858631 [Helianthus annuus]|uniref:Uncharacterized protein n=1 Tax=Helianthus annuus TaxID=4232 RepID=A0A251TUU2_HELAN|nr:hypothetical protein HanXRQr2_Chr03g0096201 [Helianthus annuus]KAJ0942513.1 hypothetical protein HanPSC8_Chr03g0092801 [Helianthus annuus]KAJ0953750.1 hypothetical protein HanRHA438_Chr00c49g0858631 [Helianthus annuus]
MICWHGTIQVVLARITIMTCLMLPNLFGKLIYRCIKMLQNGEQRNSLITGTCVMYLVRIAQMEEMPKQMRILYLI